MTTPLMRRKLMPLYKAAQEVHPGLLLQRGFVQHDESGSDTKTKHIDRICRTTPSDFYRRAYKRWKGATDDKTRFRAVALKLRTRLFIGLSGGGMLETGCAIAHTHGTPYIPGSSVKGVVAAYARAHLQQNEALLSELFGASADAEQHPNALSGLIAFHDAWWVPDSADHPLVQEVVTTHHSDYYGSGGATAAATDFDSPVPNAQVAVQGSFRFAVEGPQNWLDLAEEMLTSALVVRGVGAKTHSGYGLFAEPEDEHASVPTSGPGAEWVDATIAEITKQYNAKPDDTLRGRLLAQQWSAIEDPALQQSALAEIQTRWSQQGWWDHPPGPASKKARGVYGAYLKEQERSS